MVWRLRRSRQISFVPLPWRCSPGEASHYYLKRRLSGIGVNCVGAPRRREVTRLLKSGTMRGGVGHGSVSDMGWKCRDQWLRVRGVRQCGWPPGCVVVGESWWGISGGGNGSREKNQHLNGK